MQQPMTNDHKCNKLKFCLLVQFVIRHKREMKYIWELTLLGCLGLVLGHRRPIKPDLIVFKPMTSFETSMNYIELMITIMTLLYFVTAVDIISLGPNNFNCLESNQSFPKVRSKCKGKFLLIIKLCE